VQTVYRTSDRRRSPKDRKERQARARVSGHGAVAAPPESREPPGVTASSGHGSPPRRARRRAVRTSRSRARVNGRCSYRAVPVRSFPAGASPVLAGVVITARTCDLPLGGVAVLGARVVACRRSGFPPCVRVRVRAAASVARVRLRALALSGRLVTPRVEGARCVAEAFPCRAQQEEERPAEGEESLRSIADHPCESSSGSGRGRRPRQGFGSSNSAVTCGRSSIGSIRQFPTRGSEISTGVKDSDRPRRSSNRDRRIPCGGRGSYSGACSF
jgi:hypothetical protein